MVALALELALIALGLWLYLRTTRAIDATGKWVLWALVALLTAINLGNAFGAPPPSDTAIAWVWQAQWILVAWGYRMGRHRIPRAETR